MFEQLPSGRTRKSVVASGVTVLVEVALIGVLVLIPLLYTQTLPMADISSMLTMAPLPPPPPPPPPPAAMRVAKIVPHVFRPNVLTAPAVIPKQVVIDAAPQDNAAATSFAGVPGGVPGGVPNGTIGGVLGSIAVAAAPPPPAPPAAPAAAPTLSRLKVGGQVQAAKLVHQVLPEYPKLASVAHVHGTVQLHAIIAKDGTVKNLTVISGQPLLIPAAVDAVKQWVYRPTVLNDVPIEIETEIAVNFAQSAT